MGYWDKKSVEEKEEKAPEDLGDLAQLEKDCEEELGELEKSFRERMSAENKRFRDMCDTEYWFCVCFSSRGQKEEFMRKASLDPSDKYIDGKDLARAFRKSLQTPDLEFARFSKTSKEYLELSR